MLNNKYKNKLRNFYLTVLDFILPRICASCGTKLTQEENVICNHCKEQLTFADNKRLEHEYLRNFSKNNFIDDFTSLFVFESRTPIQNLIHSLKYDNKFRNGNYIGQQIAVNLKNKILSWQPSFIIPIPLHSLKKAERGYNQSYHIAKGISSVLNIPVKQKIIKRIRYTQTQTKLNMDERKENMRDAFLPRNSEVIRSSRIILLDDVITTGATVSECGRILKEYGADKVFALSAAMVD